MSLDFKGKFCHVLTASKVVVQKDRILVSVGEGFGSSKKYEGQSLDIAKSQQVSVL